MFLEKHEKTKILVKGLAEKAIVFAETNALWAEKRKVIAGAFYKGKLEKMALIIKRVILQNMEEWKKKDTIDLF